MGWRISHEPGQVLLHVPTDMIYQPTDLSSQLHITFDANGRFSALHQLLRDGNWGLLRYDQYKISFCILRSQVEQSSWTDQQPESEGSPLHKNDPTFLSDQPLHRVGFLYQHMVKQQHDASVHLVYRPNRRRQGKAKALEDCLQHGKRGLRWHSPPLSGTAPSF
jgi:hypothetical protein